MAEKKKNMEATVRDIRRATRKKYTAEEKVRIVLEGFPGESTIAELCRKEGTHTNLYCKWRKEFMEAGKQRLVGDTQLQADSREAVEMRNEVEQMKLVVAELMLKNRAHTPAIPLVSLGDDMTGGARKKSLLGRQRRGTNDTCICMQEQV